MKQFSCHIMMIILLACGIGFYQEVAQATAAEVEVSGQIGGTKANVQPPKESEPKTDTKLAQPKQTHIELRKFPNTGSIIENVVPIGLLLLLIYLVLNRWKAHRKTV